MKILQNDELHSEIIGFIQENVSKSHIVILYKGSEIAIIENEIRNSSLFAFVLSYLQFQINFRSYNHKIYERSTVCSLNFWLFSTKPDIKQ